jgi:hypothetical protein
LNNFQGDASRDGADYHVVCTRALKRFGFTIAESKLRVVDCGVEVDIAATNAQGIIFMIECKGGYNRGDKPGGLRSSDNTRKAIASAYCLSRSETHTDRPYTPLMVMTTYMADQSSVMYDQLSVVETRVMLDVVTDRDDKQLKYWSRADWFRIESHIATYPTVTWAIEANSYWCFPARVPQTELVRT